MVTAHINYHTQVYLMILPARPAGLVGPSGATTIAETGSQTQLKFNGPESESHFKRGLKEREGWLLVGWEVWERRFEQTKRSETRRLLITLATGFLLI